MQRENIAGKVIFITGGSSGLGEAMARYLAACGAKLAIAARRKDRLERIAAEIRETGGEALPLELDVTDAQAVKAAVEKAAEHYGRFDVMINNAGAIAVAPLSRGHIAAWNRMININIKGVLYGIAAALPIFEKQNSGHFINISSVAGRCVAAPGSVVYSATKFAVCALSEGLRQEVSAKIRVTCIEPGITESEIFSGEIDEELRPLLNEFRKDAIPANAVARAAAYAIAQPANVNIGEIFVRPTAEKF